MAGMGQTNFANAVFGQTGGLEQGALYDAALTRLAASISSISAAGSVTWAVSPTQSVDYKALAASITYTSNIVPATVTGFSWPVVAGGTYLFEVNMPTTMTTNGGLTVSFKLTTATLASIQYQSYAATASDNTTGVSTNGTTTTDATKVFDSATAAYTHVNIKGSFVTTLGGTFAWQACQNTSAGGGDVSLILIGAVAQLTRIL